MTRSACLIALCLLLAGTAVPAARAVPIACDKSPYDVDLAVVYANGMLTAHSEAVANTMRLRTFVEGGLGLEPYTTAFGLAYNSDEQLLVQARKVIRERLSLTGAEALRALTGLKAMPDAVRDEIVHLAAEYVQAGFLNDRDLERHVQTYRDHLRKGHKVVVIAHSEGNFYANAAYERLFRTALKTPGERSFGIVGIALPAPKIAAPPPPGDVPGCSEKRGCYTTFGEDLVVAAVRKLPLDTAPPNVFFSGMLASGLGDLGWHGLTQSYLKADDSREQILAQVAAFVRAFEPLDAVINDSQVTASLEWNTTADLDLHVREQFGNSGHVWAGDPDNGVGQLDADDRDGYGPENYFIECTELDKGNLKFAVGYYEGSGPVIARLRIKIGSSSRVFERTLTEPLGALSGQRPQDVAIATVQNRPKSSISEDNVDTKDQVVDDYLIELSEVGKAK